MDTEKLLLYIRGNDQDKDEIERWAESSPENAEELRQLALADYAMRHKGYEGDFDEEKAWKRVMHRSSLRRLLPVISVAAALAVFAAGTLFGTLVTDHSGVGPDMVTISSGNGKTAEVTLPDGTLARLNARTRISFPSSFRNRPLREVEISGEACFNVAPDQDRNFVVHTGKDVTVTDLGTVFNVQSYERDSIVQVTLLEGLVRTDILKDGAVNDTHYLKPGDNLSYNCNSGDLAIVNRGEGSGAEWLQNRLTFADTPLNEVARQLSHLFGKPVRMGPGLEQVRFSGTFDDKNAGTILSYISIACGVVVEESDDLVFIKRK